MNYKIIIAVFVAFILGYLSNCKQCDKPMKSKVIKAKIEERKTEVETIEEKTKVLTDKLRPLKLINSDLTSEIIQAKERKDTVKIVVVQDSLIEVQRLQIKTLESIVFMKDKTIDALKDIIEFQDMDINSLQSEIIDKNKDLKKFKRRKDLTLIGWVATTIGLIVILK